MLRKFEDLDNGLKVVVLDVEVVELGLHVIKKKMMKNMYMTDKMLLIYLRKWISTHLLI